MPAGGVMSVFTAPFAALPRRRPKPPAPPLSPSVRLRAAQPPPSSHIPPRFRRLPHTPCRRGSPPRSSSAVRRENVSVPTDFTASLRTSPRSSACRSSASPAAVCGKQFSFSDSAAHSTVYSSPASTFRRIETSAASSAPRPPAFCIPSPCAHKFPQISHFRPFHRNLPRAEHRLESEDKPLPLAPHGDRLNTG